MGTITTRFIYNHIEEALSYSSYYSDLLTSYKNTFESQISFDGEHYTLEFKIHDSNRGKNNTRNSEGTRYLPESSTENS